MAPTVMREQRPVHELGARVVRKRAIVEYIDDRKIADGDDDASYFVHAASWLALSSS
jgi:hypothetical protein